jgi:hypothetical protein
MKRISDSLHELLQFGQNLLRANPSAMVVLVAGGAADGNGADDAIPRQERHRSGKTEAPPLTIEQLLLRSKFE